MDQLIQALTEIGAIFEEEPGDPDLNAGLWKGDFADKVSVRLNKRDRLEKSTRPPDLTFPALSPAERDGVTTRGLEALAWYRPYHIHHSDWGITIRNRGIEIVAKDLTDQGVPLSTAIRVAEKSLLNHELGHFQAENAVSLIEVANRQAFYVPQLKATNWAVCEIEEALCNALAHESAGRWKRQLAAILSNAPKGYRDWKKHKRSNRQASWGAVVGLLTQGQPHSSAVILDLQNLLSFVRVSYVQDGHGLNGEVLGK